MSWASAVSRPKPAARKPAGVFNPRPTAIYRPVIVPEEIDWARLVSLDFETYYDAEYTLSKLSTSEYVRDPRFEVLMVGIKVGNKPTRVVPGNKVAAELRKIPWATHSLLCHNTQFDGFILSHHYDIHPQRLYCTLSMARGLHSNEIGSGLDEVSVFYDGRGKVQGVLEEQMKGIHFKELFANKKLWDSSTTYCAQDVEEMLHIFKQMVPKMPRVEMDLIHLTNRMFVQPVLKVDLPRVQKELDRELAERKALLMNALTPQQLRDIEADEAELKKILKTRAERSLTGEARVELITKRVVGSNERFADLLRAEGVEPPVKISPAWMKKPAAERFDEDKWAYAFAKDDLDFVNLPDNIEQLGEGLNLNKKADVEKLAARQQRLRSLVDVRLAVKSTSNITRAERFLRAGANGMPLPVGYAYARAHCLTGDAQVLTRSGWVALAGWSGGDIAQWSEDGAIKFAPATPNEFVVDETLVVAEAPYHRAKYTKGHTLPTYTSAGTFKPRKAGEALSARFDLPLSGVLDGTADITPLEAQLAVMVQADGNVRSDMARGLCVRFGFSKLRKIQRCKALLAQAGISFTETWEEDVCRIRVGAAHYAQLTRLVGPYKQFDKDLFDAPAVTKKAFIDELAFWDGSPEPQPKGFSYLTTDEYNAQFVATMAHLSGRAAKTTTRKRSSSMWSDMHTVYVRSDVRTRSIPAHYREVEFRGKVYCPTTQTGYFLVRQDGYIVVTGNTGRWGGNNKMNMQNLQRGGELRQSILAPSGHVICVADSGQIEARVNGMLWGQDDLLEAFRVSDEYERRVGGMPKDKRPPPALHERDAYCRFGDDIYGRTITKADTMERFVGKVCVLGLGYQMGAPKLQITLARGALGGPPVFFELDRCKEIVNTYRRRNYRIAQGWEICAGIIEDMAIGREGSHGPICWEQDTIWLPNGMRLHYPDLKKAPGDKGWDEWTYQAKEMRKKIYGGLLCENLVQALARIIVAEQMLQIDTFARVVMTTHDEVVAIARKAQADRVMTRMIKTMQTSPKWWPGIPLNAEGGYAVNYSK